MMAMDEGIRLINDRRSFGVSDEEGNGPKPGGDFTSNQKNPELLESKRNLDNLMENGKPGLINLFVFVLAMGNAADAVEILCVGFIMSDIQGVTTTDKELLSAAVFLGMLFGGILCGYLSDIIGRRPCLLYSLGLNSFAGIASAFAKDVHWLIVFRIFGGLGIGGSVPVVFSLGAELFPSAVRGQKLSVIASFWMMGAIYTAAAAWIMLGIPSTYVGWRWFAAFSALPALTALFLTFFYLPESPRFLVKKGKYVEAAAVAEMMTGLTVDPLFLMSRSSHTDSQSSQVHPSSFFVASPLSTATSEHSILPSESPHTSDASPHSSSSSSSPSPSTAKPSTISLLFDPSLRRTTITLWIVWFTLSFGSYGISTWISVLFEDVGISNPYRDTFIFALANLPGNAFTVMYLDRLGRRSLLSWGMCLAAMSSMGFALGKSNASVVVLCAALFNAFSVVGWNSLDCMSVEFFPTIVRTSGMGVLSTGGRLGAITAQFVNGQLESSVSMLFTVTSICMVIGGLCSWLLPHDSTGTLLEDEVEEVKNKEDAIR